MRRRCDAFLKDVPFVQQGTRRLTRLLIDVPAHLSFKPSPEMLDAAGLRPGAA